MLAKNQSEKIKTYKRKVSALTNKLNAVVSNNLNK